MFCRKEERKQFVYDKLKWNVSFCRNNTDEHISVIIGPGTKVYTLIQKSNPYFNPRILLHIFQRWLNVQSELRFRKFLSKRF